jgi:serine/threonine protein kinase
MNSWAGTTLGKVRIDSLLARGGMAEVYLGTHTTLHREVVVKVLRGHSEDDPTLLDRFQREARVVAKLRHPNIVQVFDFDTVDDQPYIVMEYIRGPSLAKYLRALHEKIGRPGIPQISRILIGVASALQYAHESGVIHRDVKPGNILLASRSGQIVPGEPLPTDFEAILTDFGLVRILSTSEQTTVGRIAGTPAYMSPEQARGEQTDARTDIYSLGIVLYQLLAGRVPFEGDSTISILLKHINDPPAPIPGLSAPLQEVLDRALAKNVPDRFQSARELASEFNTVVEESAEASTLAGAGRALSKAPTKPTGPQAKPRRGWIQAALAGIVVLAFGAFSLYNGFPTFGNKPQTPSPTISPTIETPVGLVASSLGPTGVLRFADGSAIMDKAVLTALAMPAPPPGNQYEVWLISQNDVEPRSLGILVLEENGKGVLSYEDGQDQNLLALYNQVEIRLKPATDSNPDLIGQVAYSYTLPASALEFVRRLLVSSPLAPDQVALIQGLYSNTKIMNALATEMLTAHENGNEAGLREAAEAILNLLVGAQSQEHKDWDGNGRVADRGDGYGFWLNGDHLGYIQAVYSHADYAANAPGTSQNMIVNGERVKICAENLAQWTPRLRDQVLAILTSASASEMDEAIRDSAASIDQILNGIDRDNNGRVEPISAECGVQTAYEYAYYMADMLLLPVNLLDTPTPTSTPSPTTTSSGIITLPTSSSGQLPNTSVAPSTPIRPTSNPPTNPPSNPTDPPGNPPTDHPRPTKRPSHTPRPPQNPHGDPQPTKQN